MYSALIALQVNAIGTGNRSQLGEGVSSDVDEKSKTDGLEIDLNLSMGIKRKDQ